MMSTLLRCDVTVEQFIYCIGVMCDITVSHYDVYFIEMCRQANEGTTVEATKTSEGKGQPVLKSPSGF